MPVGYVDEHTLCVYLPGRARFSAGLHPPLQAGVSSGIIFPAGVQGSLQSF